MILLYYKKGSAVMNISEIVQALNNISIAESNFEFEN